MLGRFPDRPTVCERAGAQIIDRRLVRLRLVRHPKELSASCSLWSRLRVGCSPWRVAASRKRNFKDGFSATSSRRRQASRDPKQPAAMPACRRANPPNAGHPIALRAVLRRRNAAGERTGGALECAREGRNALIADPFRHASDHLVARNDLFASASESCAMPSRTRSRWRRLPPRTGPRIAMRREHKVPRASRRSSLRWSRVNGRPLPTIGSLTPRSQLACLSGSAFITSE